MASVHRVKGAPDRVKVTPEKDRPYRAAEAIAAADQVADFYGTLVNKGVPTDVAEVLTEDWLHMRFTPTEED